MTFVALARSAVSRDGRSRRALVALGVVLEAFPIHGTWDPATNAITGGSPAPLLSDSDIAWLPTRMRRLGCANAFRAVALDATDARSFRPGDRQTCRRRGARQRHVEQIGNLFLAADFEVSVDGENVPPFLSGAVGVHRHSPRMPARPRPPNGCAIRRCRSAVCACGRSLVPTPSQRPSTSRRSATSALDRLRHARLPPVPQCLQNSAMAPGAASVRRVHPTRDSRGHPRSGGRTPYARGCRSATIQVVVEGTPVTEGECRVDGSRLSRPAGAGSKLSWSEGSPSCMFTSCSLQAPPSSAI